MVLADIFITTKDRPHFLKRSLESLRRHTDRGQYRLTIVRDGSYAGTHELCRDDADYVLTNNKNAGLGPSINMALAHINALKQWDARPGEGILPSDWRGAIPGGLPIDAPPLTIYIQDDVLYSNGWLEKLSTKFIQLEKQLNLGFASGVECVEHPIKRDLGGGMVLKDWIRATSMLARHDYWMSMWPIPRIDPETGEERGRPYNGLGSSVDWWFLRNHPNSVCRTGRTNLVIPGLLQHMGFDQSTWLKRELPESESDKTAIRNSER